MIRHVQHLIYLVLIIISFNTIGASLKIDGRGYCSPPELDITNGQYFVTFYATSASLESLSPGHAYISLYAPNDAHNNICVPEKGFGQYPSDNKSIIAMFKKSNGSGVKQENLMIMKPAHQLQVRVTYETYTKVQRLTKEWDDAKYVLGVKDCITFVNAVAKSTPWLNVPDRKLNQLPFDYLNNLIAMNQ
ncbi:hypothetical protein ACRRS0_15160 [Agarivorans sp. QJM3NY_29]|uniref:hypothetical protein n=1 Tax=unclassified Agarivorans TaxID=2636026 RepID=UPI003D7E6E69